MQIRQILNWAIQKKKIPNLDAEVLLCFVIKKNKSFIYSHPEFELNKMQENKFKKIINRRVKNEPVAYIIGNKEFYKLNFFVDKTVLIPRPETEILVEESLSVICDQLSETRKKIQILEIGTGSGCVLISILKNLITNHYSLITGFATDISKKALLIAKKNAKSHKVNNKIKFIKSDLLKNIPDSLFNNSYSVLVANLPYLLEKYKKQVDKDLFFEPQKALFAGEDGLFFINKLLKQISKLKNKPKYILLEIDPSQKNKLKIIINKKLPNYKIKIKKDLDGKNRVIIIKL